MSMSDCWKYYDCYQWIYNGAETTIEDEKEEDDNQEFNKDNEKELSI